MPSSYGETLQACADALPPSSRRLYTATARRFLEFSGGRLDREAVLAFIKRLETEGYTRNTIRRHHMVAVKGLFRAAGIPWPLRRWELPQVSEREVYAPALDQVGWHAIWRALTRGLVQAGLPEPAIRDFLRWKRSESDMLRYHASTVVGEDGRFLDPGRQDREVDEALFAVHPGKGSVQAVIPVGGGSAVRLTTARCLTPNGHVIEGNPLKPHILVGEEDRGPRPKFSWRRPLKVLTVGLDVLAAQELLVWLGYPVGEADGIYGRNTSARVSVFQREHGLPATGVLDEATARAMNEAAPRDAGRKKGDEALEKALEYLRQALGVAGEAAAD